ncbi:efflux RND transporter periplasmic adaptor subunit [Fulvivirga kasyanovii]|uniref:Efflux RND transporter periplasmic adaptor subunit n=1 Tax=Fulvivirga kasyanovii TaxID=396812 RepID=A0ABW9RMC5_9BACT|nr:efflux RND transporter periplasmic adaptor subunit [Fulvivirga kasyanovii]MTI25141.1 efflux RND transporter periplasmic adaptor subunit [Fulvivirga kasyanovii]
MSKKKTLIICLGILLAGAIVTAIIFFTEPEAVRSGATKETAMLVDVTEAEYGDFHPTIVTTGTVQPAKDIMLSPRVSGQVTMLSENFVPGGFVRKGELLLQIDPADYRNALQLRQSELSQALADLHIEMGRQDIARMDYELVGDSLPDENEALVLREPQLNAIKARVKAARAAVDQARLDLRRASIRAPFDAHILERNVNVGSQVAPGNNLGRLVGMNTYWVVVTVPVSQLRWLSFPESNLSKGSTVKVRDRSAWPEGEYRTGNLYKMVGALDDQTRLARVLVAVRDPLVHQADSSNQPRLMIGSFMETRITGNKIEDVIRLNRDYVRNNETVWVMEKGKLQIREVNILLNDARYAYITDGLTKNDRIVTTNLTTVANGSPLRINKSDSTGQAALSDSVNHSAH